MRNAAFIVLRRARSEDVPRLAEALAAAFHEDPALEWLMLRERKRPLQLRAHHDFRSSAGRRSARGLGTRLMAPTSGSCGADGLPAYVEASSERNPTLYERLGFKLIVELSYGAASRCG